ncbi:UvrD-helicase domain-containing protein [Priestia filamentosa]|uniref:UvrD-helicase domain-containing protein n=1 Tax=Priestia filamentosa TaxID=1402861 RepID=UPI0002FB1858|nr:ATP-dependent helicase [Priestia filamentosa]
MKLNDNQKDIISHDGSLVVLANPGSGKTSTLAHKIKTVLPDLLDFQGVIAISYTNKASDELKERALKGHINKKGSFFGTIDKFYLMEIIYPFGGHVFNSNSKDFEIIDKETSSNQTINKYRNLLGKENSNPFDNEMVRYLQSFFEDGKILIETVGILAIYIFDNCIACQKYLHARFTHLIIDEYQDCGWEQHSIFLRLHKLGMICIAVGDENQSIYGFSNKSSKHLVNLMDNTKFKTFYLDRNYRCHKSIINYSLKMLDPSFQVEQNSEKRVRAIKVKGTEENIAKYISRNIDNLIKDYGVKQYNQVGILVRTGKTADIVAEHLEHSFKYFKNTPLDNDSSLWAGVFKKTLLCILNPESTFYEFAAEYFDVDDDYKQIQKIIKLLCKLREESDKLLDSFWLFVEIASMIYPNAANEKAITKLEAVLISKDYLESYQPAEEHEIQIMTLHKSKGLEFEIVFHLDLYEFVIPQKRKVDGHWIYQDYRQCLNLHYVGVTRAKKCCYLLTSSRRTNSKGFIMDAKPSEFFFLPGIGDLRAK